jgi:ABC-2 type transport system permease protein
MRVANILHLGIKELRGLARGPVMLGTVVFAFTVVIYSAAKAAVALETPETTAGR